MGYEYGTWQRWIMSELTICVLRACTAEVFFLSKNVKFDDVKRIARNHVRCPPEWSKPLLNLWVTDTSPISSSLTSLTLVYTIHLVQ